MNIYVRSVLFTPGAVILLYLFIRGLLADEIVLWKVDVSFYGIWAKIFIVSAIMSVFFVFLCFLTSNSRRLFAFKIAIWLSLAIHLSFHFYGIVISWMRMF